MVKKYSFLKSIIKLSRFYLSLAIAFSALAGFIFFSHSLNLKALFAFLGVLFFSGTASALNQYQEKRPDAMMDRTKDRPLPSKRLQPNQALIITIILGITGFFLMFLGTSPIAAILGCFNLLWYSAVYTPLKKRTRYAVFAGALTGALPPIMGWVAAGGYIFSPAILLVALFMYLWQIPHFLIFLLKYGKEYEEAGFHSFSSVKEDHLKQIIFIFLLAASASSLLFPFFNLVSNYTSVIILIVINILIIFYFYLSLFLKKSSINFSFIFHSLYIYQFLITILLVVEALI